MSDTVEFGGWRPPPRWVWAVAGVALVAVLAGVVSARSRPHNAASSRPGPATGSPSAGSREPGTVARWPTAVGACGSPVYLPQIRLAARGADVHVTLLVGGTALRQVTPGRAVYRALPGLWDQGLMITKLVAGPDADYAFVDPRCSGYLWVYRITSGVAQVLNTPADDLLGGPHHAWAVTYAPHTVLTPLNGGRKITLRSRTDPVADTADGLVVAHRPRAARPDTVELIDPGTGALVRHLAAGFPLGAAGHVVLLSRPGCGAPLTRSRCTLESVDLRTGRPAATFEMPAGRVPVTGAVFSPDGTAAAFQLARARQDPRFTTGSPFPPADVMVLHLRTGGIDIVPGLELAPETAAGLVFDPTGNWLLAMVSKGDRGELMAWRQGMTGPALVTSVPGPLMAPPPVLPAPPSQRNG